jgi:hypothetical protein
MGGAGPWGATLVRFLFGLPFATVFAASPGPDAGRAALIRPPGSGWPAARGGARSRHGRAADAMHRSTFALGTALQQSGLPFALVWGALVFGDGTSVR